MRTCSPTRFAVALLEAVLEDDGPPDLPTELEGQPFLLATMIANMGRDGEGAGGVAGFVDRDDASLIYIDAVDELQENLETEGWIAAWTQFVDDVMRIPGLSKQAHRIGDAMDKLDHLH